GCGAVFCASAPGEGEPLLAARVVLSPANAADTVCDPTPSVAVVSEATPATSCVAGWAAPAMVKTTGPAGVFVEPTVAVKLTGSPKRVGVPLVATVVVVAAGGGGDFAHL